MTRDQLNLRSIFASVMVFSLAFVLAGCPVDETPRILQANRTPVEATPDAAADPEAAPLVEDPEVDVREVVEDEAALEAQPLEEAEITVRPEGIAEAPAELAGEAIETLNLSEVLVRSRFLINRNVEAADGETIGTLNDLLFEAETGRILYVIFTHGGLLGVGGNTVAAPIDAFHWSPQLNMRLMVNQDALDLLPTVDDQWPTFGDATWDDEISAFWRGAGLDVADEPALSLIRATRLIDLQAGQMGGPIGVVEDIVLNLGEKRAIYLAIFATPGFHQGDVIIPMPFELLVIETVADEAVPVIFVEEALFLAAPAMDRSLFLNVDFMTPEVIEPLTTYWQEQGFLDGVEGE
jgi:sporulation protein YlmC with PRC-barrel domain